MADDKIYIQVKFFLSVSPSSNPGLSISHSTRFYFHSANSFLCAEMTVLAYILRPQITCIINKSCYLQVNAIFSLFFILIQVIEKKVLYLQESHVTSSMKHIIKRAGRKKTRGKKSERKEKKKIEYILVQTKPVFFLLYTEWSSHHLKLESCSLSPLQQSPPIIYHVVKKNLSMMNRSRLQTKKCLHKNFKIVSPFNINSK